LGEEKKSIPEGAWVTAAMMAASVTFSITWWIVVSV
jgi:hypothetical protein